MGFLEGGITGNKETSIIDPATSVDEALERGKAVEENTVTGTHPITQGLGGPATKGASLLANSGKLLSKAPRLLSGRKALSGANAAKKLKSAGKSIDLAPRLASWGTSGTNPVEYAQNTADDVDGAVDAALNWEAPDIDIPTPGDEPQPDQAPVLALAAAGAAVVGGAILLTQGGIRA